MKRINVLWAIDHVCYDGSLHGGGRLYWNVLPHFDPERVRVVPCMLRASDTIRKVFEASPVPVRILDKPKFDPTTLWTFLRLIKRERIDVMHLHCYGCSTFGRIAGLITGIPTVIHDYDTEVYFPYPSYLSVADRLLAPSTRAAVAASPMCRHFLVHRRNVDDARVLTMFHAIPMDKYPRDPAASREAAREQLGIDPGAEVLCTVTKLGPQRGSEVLLKATRDVVARRPSALLLFVYKPTLFHRLPDKRYVDVSRAEEESQVGVLARLAADLGIEKYVRFIEAPENLDELVAASDVFVAPFLSERFSSVNLLEAMAMGKPVVATDLGEQREFVRNGVNGYLVAPGDERDLARASITLLEDRSHHAQAGKEARITAEAQSVRACAERLQDLYAGLVANGSQRPSKEAGKR